MNNYYIYIYLDPRKSGKYCYENFSFLYRPIYIGKGKGKRLKIINKRNPFFKNKINKIKQSGLEPIVFKLYENLNEEKSFELETKLIKEIGRLDLGLGPLLNMTNGGEGTSGLNHTNKTKNKISKKMKGKNHPQFGTHHSIDTKNKISQNHATVKGERNPRHKLTEEQVIQIKLLLKEGILTQREIAKMFKIDYTIINKIKNEKLWKHIII